MLRQIAILLFFVTAAVAEDLPSYGALEGIYDVVGRKPDSKETYSGTIKLISDAAGLRIERRIGATTQIGTGKFAFKTPDKIPVLEMSFKEGQDLFESSCRVGWDLDNYARITCLYGVIEKTKEPGMEAFFIQRVSD